MKPTKNETDNRPMPMGVDSETQLREMWILSGKPDKMRVAESAMLFSMLKLSITLAKKGR
jgi:hypothetical protein